VTGPSADTYQTVRECLINALQLDPDERGAVGPRTKVSDLKKWDSRGHLTFVVELEHCLGIQFDDDEVVELTSVEAVLRAVARKRG
jgi:acyl carrier protein